MKKILLGLLAIVVVVGGVAGLSAFEAHIINVTAHIENALSLDAYGIDFGTVFPQEYVEKPFTISLSQSFKDETDVASVSYELIQKDKPWTLNFGGNVADVDAHNRTLIFVDPDPGKGEEYTISGGKLTITTGNDIEDLFDPGQTVSGTDWTAPRMVIPMGGNFIIETQVTANALAYPAVAYQSGGILVYGSDGNVVRLELTRFSGLGTNAVYMESQENGNKVGEAWNGVGENDTVYLRLSRNGNVFKGEYSINGIIWNPVTVKTPNDFVNEQIGNNPKVGLAVTDNDEDNTNSSFSASFEYISFNKGYLSLCSFLSKTKADPTVEDDIDEPSYYKDNGTIETTDDSCRAIDADVPNATGTLTRGEGQDESDTWMVDLKVPPVVGYVGQDWPETCAPWVVQENEMDYGCDIWVEVTEIKR